MNDELDKSDIFAAIDLGSNSFHMIVVKVVQNELVILDKIKEMVQLAAGLDEHNNISTPAQQRAIAALERFGQRLTHIPPQNIRILGTNTLRSARNAREFLRKAAGALGHPVEIISGIEEARLIYLGVSNSLASQGPQRLVVDIGGGSTELIIGKGHEPIALESLYMGCVSNTKRFFDNGAITTAAIDQADIAARVELEPVEAALCRLGWDEAIGTSGTIKAIDQVARTNGWSQNGFTLEALQNIVKLLLQAGHVDNLEINGLSSERAPVFAAGVVILTAVFKALGIEIMRVSNGALREGAIYDLLGRTTNEDIRIRSVYRLAQRFHCDVDHAKRVESTAIGFLSQVAEAWNLEAERFSPYLSWGAQLHQIGLDIAHSSYHKHGAYIIEKSDLAGFSWLEQKALSLLVLGHRQKFPTRQISQVGAPFIESVEYLTILLRLAVLMHRSRAETPLPPIELVAADRELHITFPTNWLESHALTRADLEREIAYLHPINFKLCYSDSDTIKTQQAYTDGSR